MSFKAITLHGEQSAIIASDHLSALARLAKVESSLLSLLQELNHIRTDIEKQVSKNPGLEPLMEAEAVAKVLGVDVGYVYQQARAGKIPSLKLGKYRKFSPSQIKKWLDRKSIS
jgi:excisionase family DNA binding protein